MRLRRSGVDQNAGLRPPRVRPVDQVRAALGAIVARPTRSILTSAGTVLGTAALVATIGLTATAREQISDVFAGFDTNELAVSAAPTEDGSFFDEQRIAVLRSRLGVVSAGELYRLDNQYSMSGGRLAESGAVSAIYALSPSIADALDFRMVWGRPFSTGSESRGDRVVLVSQRIADQIGLENQIAGSSVAIDGVPFGIAGVYDDVGAHNELLLGVVVPASTGRRLEPGTSPRLVVQTAPGVASSVAEVVPRVLDPAAPERLTVVTPPQAKQVRAQVDESIANLMLVLAGVALAVSGLGIANTTLMAVVERSGEIGLRRALGARRRHIATQFILESGLLGGIGAIVGVWLGTLVVVWASAVRGWSPVIEFWPLFVGPMAGLIVGILAGLYPALRAAQLEPAVVLKR